MIHVVQGRLAQDAVKSLKPTNPNLRRLGVSWQKVRTALVADPSLAPELRAFVRKMDAHRDAQQAA